MWLLLAWAISAGHSQQMNFEHQDASLGQPTVTIATMSSRNEQQVEQPKGECLGRKLRFGPKRKAEIWAIVYGPNEWTYLRLLPFGGRLMFVTWSFSPSWLGSPSSCSRLATAKTLDLSLATSVSSSSSTLVVDVNLDVNVDAIQFELR